MDDKTKLRTMHPSALDQKDPLLVEGESIFDLVKRDLEERESVGKARYGTTLKANNGRDALLDAYAEALDLVVYLRQAIEERNA
jgi:hypothetical protein